MNNVRKVVSFTKGHCFINQAGTWLILEPENNLHLYFGYWFISIRPRLIYRKKQEHGAKLWWFKSLIIISKLWNQCLHLVLAANRLLLTICRKECGDMRARFKLVWLRDRWDRLKMALISSQGWCKACRARLNASNPVCSTENNPGTAASAPGSCAGAAFKETEGPKFHQSLPRINTNC